MSAFNAIRELVGRRRKAAPTKQTPEPPHDQPQPMTGFLAGLTDEQRKAALQPMEPDLAGDVRKLDAKRS